MSILISHPQEGLILYEAGAGKDYPEVWGPPLNDIFARVDHKEDYELDVAIAKTGNNIKDVKAVIMGHLHLDHAGGLEHFRDTGVPIYVHELELKHAFYSVATKFDLGTITFILICRILLTTAGVYLPKDLTFNQNWTPFSGQSFEFAQGITLHHSPGHTPGLAIMQLNLEKSGTWIATTDQYHVKENFFADQPQGWLARDHDDWWRSHQMIKGIKKRTDAKMVFGHCRETLLSYDVAPKFYE